MGHVRLPRWCKAATPHRSVTVLNRAMLRETLRICQRCRNWCERTAPPVTRRAKELGQFHTRSFPSELQDRKYVSWRERVEECPRTSSALGRVIWKILRATTSRHTSRTVAVGHTCRLRTEVPPSTLRLFHDRHDSTRSSKASNGIGKKLRRMFSHTHTGARSITELARDDRYVSADLSGRDILDEAFTTI
jgi:hypothetical protein